MHLAAGRRNVESCSLLSFVLILLVCTPALGVEISYVSGGETDSVSVNEKYSLDNSASLQEETVLGPGSATQVRDVEGSGANYLYQRIFGSKGYNVDSQVDSSGILSSSSRTSASGQDVALAQDVSGQGDLSFLLAGSQGDDSANQQGCVQQGAISSSQSIVAGHSVFVDQATSMSGECGKVGGAAHYKNRMVKAESGFSRSGSITTDLGSSATGRVDLRGSVALEGGDLDLQVDSSEGEVTSSYNVKVQDRGRESQERLSGTLLAHAGSPKITSTDVTTTGDLVDIQGQASNPQGDYVSSCNLEDVSGQFQSAEGMSLDEQYLLSTWHYPINPESPTPIPESSPVVIDFTIEGVKSVSDKFWVTEFTSGENAYLDYDISGSLWYGNDFLNINQNLNVIYGDVGVDLLGKTWADGKGYLSTEGYLRADCINGGLYGNQYLRQEPYGGYVKQNLANNVLSSDTVVRSVSRGFSDLPGRATSEQPYSLAEASGTYILGGIINSIADVTWGTHGSEVIERTRASADVYGSPGTFLMDNQYLRAESSYKGEKATSSAQYSSYGSMSDASVCAETVKSASAEVEMETHGSLLFGAPQLETKTIDRYGNTKSGLKCTASNTLGVVEYRSDDPTTGQSFSTNFEEGEYLAADFQGHLTSYAYPNNDHHFDDEYISYVSAGIHGGMGGDLAFEHWDNGGSSWMASSQPASVAALIYEHDNPDMSVESLIIKNAYEIYRGYNIYVADYWNIPYVGLIRNSDGDYEKNELELLGERELKTNVITPWGVNYVYDVTGYSDSNILRDDPVNDPINFHPDGGQGIDLAVIDTGVDTLHPDLVMRAEDWCDHDGPGDNGYSENDPVGHGTHVAGTIVADAGIDGRGIWGMVPEADLITYKVGWEIDNNGNGSLNHDDIVTGIYRATDLGAEIISMSFGGAETSDEAEAIDYAKAHGLMLVAAAGNRPDDQEIIYPASDGDVIAVGAIDRAGNYLEYVESGIIYGTAPGDNDGDGIIEANEVMFGAPGTTIWSTTPTYPDPEPNDRESCSLYYGINSGTSMATPHISGLAAKYWSEEYQRNPLCDSDRILDLMKQRVDDIPPVEDDIWTGLGAPRYQPLT